MFGFWPSARVLPIALDYGIDPLRSNGGCKGQRHLNNTAEASGNTVVVRLPGCIDELRDRLRLSRCRWSSWSSVHNCWLNMKVSECDKIEKIIMLTSVEAMLFNSDQVYERRCENLFGRVS